MEGRTVAYFGDDIASVRIEKIANDIPECQQWIPNLVMRKYHPIGCGTIVSRHIVLPTPSERHGMSNKEIVQVPSQSNIR